MQAHRVRIFASHSIGLRGQAWRGIVAIGAMARHFARITASLAWGLVEEPLDARSARAQASAAPSALLLVLLAFMVLAARPGLAQSPVEILRDRGTGLAFRLAGTTGPVVVFESGRAEPMDNWDTVVSAVSPCVRAVTYDRLGVGQSGPLGARQVLASEVAARLHRLLRAAALPAPYILVGHSLGGLYVQSFARHYSSEVAAVVLVDASSPFEPPGVFVSSVKPQAGTAAAAEEAGVAASMRALESGPPFPPVPLIVLAATDHRDTPEREALWHSVQEKTTTLSPRGRLVTVASGHFIQHDHPEAVDAAIGEAAKAAGYDYDKERCIRLKADPSAK